MLNKHETK